ncbi:hypothetical protein KEM60_00384 [Austwickia sp. TVS 96-490-7B]|nr:hypothetical protein [Austwickia sp. TVS 96-490-7B]
MKRSCRRLAQALGFVYNDDGTLTAFHVLVKPKPSNQRKGGCGLVRKSTFPPDGAHREARREDK